MRNRLNVWIGKPGQFMVTELMVGNAIASIPIHTNKNKAIGQYRRLGWFISDHFRLRKPPSES